jgi:hypothetical protein
MICFCAFLPTSNLSRGLLSNDVMKPSKSHQTVQEFRWKVTVTQFREVWIFVTVFTRTRPGLTESSYLYIHPSSSSSSLVLQPGVGFSLLHTGGFVTIIIFWRRVAAPRPTPNLEDQVSIFISPGDWVAQLYPQASSTHFSRLLRYAWARVGLFFSRSPHGDYTHPSSLYSHYPSIYSYVYHVAFPWDFSITAVYSFSMLAAFPANPIIFNNITRTE